MAFITALGTIFIAAILLLACSRIVELLRWRHDARINPDSANQTAVAGSDVHQGHFAVRLPLWLEIPGIGAALTSIAIGLNACDAAGVLEPTQAIAITPLFIAGIVMMLLPAAGCYDIDVNRRAGYLTFRRFFICFRSVRISRIRLCQTQGGTLYLSVPNRKRPFVIDSYMHGYGQLFGLIVAENVPIITEPLAVPTGK